MSKNIMGSLEERNADISTPDAQQDWVLSVTLQPDDVHLQGVPVTQVINDAVLVSNSETVVFQFGVRHNLGVEACNELLAILRHTLFHPSTIRYTNLETWQKQMDVLNKHGIQYANMRDYTFDSAQDVYFSCRPAWDIVVDILASTRLTKCLRHGFRPQYNAESGEREYGEFASADWMKCTTTLFGDATLTILAIFLGSDATQVKHCGSTHLIYISLGNFLDSFRLRGEAWQTSGLVPRLDHSLMREKGCRNKVVGERAASKQARSRRERQLFQACAWTVLKSLVDRKALLTWYTREGVTYCRERPGVESAAFGGRMEH